MTERAIEFVLAGSGLIFSTPLLAVISLAVRLDSRGLALSAGG